MISFTGRKKTTAQAETNVPVQSGLRLHELRSRIFRNTRWLRVWLPPDYDQSAQKRYPVLYLNDGQNLFDPATAFGGLDWEVGKTAQRLIADGRISPLIIVGIDNAGRSRMREYIPYRSFDPRVWGPQGKHYPDFLLREVMPLIENHYSVAKGPEHTGLGGSSLGGLITLYTQLASPGVFGRLLIESPSLYIADRRILEECRRFRDWPFRVYLGIGSRESGNRTKDEKYVRDVRELQQILHNAGLGRLRLSVHVEEGATHSESAWRGRFPGALSFLFEDAISRE